MQLFFSNNINNRTCTLSSEESRHCIAVLRHTKGDIVKVFDNNSNLYSAKIIEDNPKKCTLEILVEEKVVKRNQFLHIAIAPTKNIDRFEWFVEKAVEIGIEAITPLICEHSERKTLRLDRVEKIVIAAMKQSVNLSFPTINPPISFLNFIESEFCGGKYIAHCAEKATSFSASIKSNKVLIMIGPEGDFSENEIQKATSLGFVSVTLGESRLRTETAGIVSSVIASERFNSLRHQ